MSSDRTIYTISYRNYNNHIVSTVYSIINGIKHDITLRLNDTFWMNCYKALIERINEDDEDNCRFIIKTIDDMFPQNTLTKKHKSDLMKSLMEEYPVFMTAHLHPNTICYCGDAGCDWGCGVQSCGGCIDVCRCWNDRW
jgi:hypothetical protein